MTPGDTRDGVKGIKEDQGRSLSFILIPFYSPTDYSTCSSHGLMGSDMVYYRLPGKREGLANSRSRRSVISGRIMIVSADYSSE